jgi:hypothetical protein
MKELIFNVMDIAVASSLATREAAKNLFANIPLNKSLETVTMDFSSIEFVSRSFADQLLKEQARLFHDSNIIVQMQNLDNDILTLINKVAETQQKSGFESSAIPVLRFTDAKTLNNFLVSI